MPTQAQNTCGSTTVVAPPGESCQEQLPSPTRLGVMLDSFDVPGWLYYLLEQVTSLQSIELALVILRPHVNAAPDRSSMLFRAWAAFDKRVHLSSTDALHPRNCRSLLERACPVSAMLLPGSGPLAEGELQGVRKAGLDLLLYLGSGAPTPEVSTCTRLGTWSVECSSSLRCEQCEVRKVPSAFREMCNEEPVFTCGLSVVARQGSSVDTLFRAFGITNYLSLAVNQNTAVWKVTDFLVSQFSDAQRLRSAQPSWASPSPQADPPCPRNSALSNLEMTRFLARWSTRVLRHEAEKRLCREQWYLAIRRRTGPDRPIDANEFRLIKPPRSRFYADPFLFERNGRTYLFFEDYPFAISKGLISCCELDSNGTPGEPRVVLEREYHLSYPFLLEFQGDVYMVPETRDNRTIEMYRAEEFPFLWVPHKVLMEDVTAADSTLLHHNGKWWMFTAGVLDRHSLNETLCLFFADSPFGPWKAHPKNPIVSDPRRARPAGAVYVENGSLIRPGQDCSNGYGYAIQLHRIEQLTENEYREAPAGRITPDWISGNRGTHTVNQTSAFQVLDARSLISRFYLRSPFSALPREYAPGHAPTPCAMSSRTK